MIEIPRRSLAIENVRRGHVQRVVRLLDSVELGGTYSAIRDRIASARTFDPESAAKGEATERYVADVLSTHRWVKRTVQSKENSKLNDEAVDLTVFLRKDQKNE